MSKECEAHGGGWSDRTWLDPSFVDQPGGKPQVFAQSQKPPALTGLASQDFPGFVESVMTEQERVDWQLRTGAINADKGHEVQLTNTRVGAQRFKRAVTKLWQTVRRTA
jgi:hypothetical protein